MSSFVASTCTAGTAFFLGLRLLAAIGPLPLLSSLLGPVLRCQPILDFLCRHSFLLTGPAVCHCPLFLVSYFARQPLIICLSVVLRAGPPLTSSSLTNSVVNVPVHLAYFLPGDLARWRQHETHVTRSLGLALGIVVFCCHRRFRSGISVALPVFSTILHERVLTILFTAHVNVIVTAFSLWMMLLVLARSPFLLHSRRYFLVFVFLCSLWLWIWIWRAGCLPLLTSEFAFLSPAPLPVYNSPELALVVCLLCVAS